MDYARARVVVAYKPHMPYKPYSMGHARARVVVVVVVSSFFYFSFFRNKRVQGEKGLSSCFFFSSSQ